jgi:hypothetical protein
VIVSEQIPENLDELQIGFTTVVYPPKNMKQSSKRKYDNMDKVYELNDDYRNEIF